MSKRLEQQQQLLCFFGCREAFDRLTEYSSLLLQHGDYNIHSTPREQIVAETDTAEAAQLQAVMGVLSTACPSSSSQIAIHNSMSETINHVADTDGPEVGHSDLTGVRAVPSAARAEAADGMEVDAPSLMQLAGSGITEAAAEQTVPADPDEDIFGVVNEAAGIVQQKPDVHDQTASTVAYMGDVSNKPQQAGSSAGSSMNGDNESISQNLGSGFLYDESSGTWYNAELGYYYDASHGLYGDPLSGQWYNYADGTYQLVC